ncbi:MAG TPA: FtsX-like permease family protein, partial [Verrucomicrobiae bacterium]|nr:FtsX-like permease family protein [Verrucomicrobiae bacterium]
IWATLPMESYVKAAYVSQRVAATLLLLLGGLALLLAGMGLYAVLAYVVGQRTQEIGIRMALGAQATDVLGMVLNQGMRLVGIGVAAGLAGSLALGRLLAGFLYGVSPFDPLVYLSVAAILAAVALAACLIPASRAARVDPMVALRND